MKELPQELQEQLNSADVSKYVSALFKAEEAFTKELMEYDKHGNDKQSNYVPPAISNLVSGSLMKKLPLKYRLMLKLPWHSTIEMVTGFLKGLGDGSTEDVIIGLARTYMESMK
jgi:hypothetical protein